MIKSRVQSKLFRAITKDNLEQVQSLVNKYPAIIDTIYNFDNDKNGRYYPLHFALTRPTPNTDIVDLLFRLAPHVLQLDTRHKTAMHYAVDSGNIRMVQRVLDFGFTNLDVRGRYDDTPIHLAAELGYTDIIELLLQSGSKAVNMTNCRSHKYPIIEAVHEGHLNTVELLIQFGGWPLNTRDQSDTYLANYVINTGPAHMIDGLARIGCDFNRSGLLLAASRRGKSDVIEALIRNGNREPTMGRIVFDTNTAKTLVMLGFNGIIATSLPEFTEEETLETRFRAYFGHSLVYRLLFLSSPILLNDDTIKAVHSAAKRGRAQKISNLFDQYGPLIIDARRHGLSPLDRAITRGQLRVIKMLIKLGSKSLSVFGKHGMMPMHRAAASGRNAVIRLLVDHGCQLDDVTGTYEEQTPMHFAAINGHIGTICAMIELGSKAIRKTDFTAKTPIDIVVMKGNPTMVTELVAFGGLSILDPNPEYMGIHNAIHCAVHYVLESYDYSLQILMLILKLRPDLMDFPKIKQNLTTTIRRVYYSSLRNRIEIIKMLLAFGAELGPPDSLNRNITVSDAEIAEIRSRVLKS
jgi:ankyrin repeat protein